jgi:hypothetical protein
MEQMNDVDYADFRARTKRGTNTISEGTRWISIGSMDVLACIGSSGGGGVGG